jgi:hypothetical protein
VSVPVWAAELAGGFWKEAGEVEAFPRHLRRPIARAVPLTVVYLPGLRLAAVQSWLARNRIAWTCPEADRPLRAFLLAGWGDGLVFIDGADPEDEQRFSLAHELAHFLRDYRQPRRLAVDRLGEGVLDVFDGLRAPTPEERLHALLARLPVGCHWHLMRRDERGRYATPAIAAAERDADRLAYELLAPAAAVLTQAGGLSRPTLVRVLRTTFGLPLAQAEDYSALLSAAGPPADPLLRRLGLAPLVGCVKRSADAPGA